MCGSRKQRACYTAQPLCALSMMNCSFATTIESDKAFWVPRDIFENEFNQHDFQFRDTQKIEKNYATHWFYEDDAGNVRFLIPTVQIVSGATQFINGRHRTAVLFSEMKKVPIAFTLGEAQKLASRLGLVALVENESFEIPDMPIVERPE